ncbi:MAG: S8 family serine peptidase, partial [Candidatus Eremiobacteraeota bacterium]|nr:S8 family serine peptidase [Candidatus Eremiobacteraeota bacterium]
RDDRVSVVESNDIVRTQVIDAPQTAEPNDLDSSLWGLNNTGQDGGTAGIDIGAKAAWETSVGSRTGPIVAVVDTGVDIRHQDLSANIWVNEGEVPGDGIDNDGNGVIDDVNGYNSAAENNDPKDDNGHGTHVAGTIGAVGNNGKGVTGVNQEARIMPVRFLSEDGSGNTADAIEALAYASRTGARVINNSWGG